MGYSPELLQAAKRTIRVGAVDHDSMQLLLGSLYRVLCTVGLVGLLGCVCEGDCGCPFSAPLSSHRTVTRTTVQRLVFPCFSLRPSYVTKFLGPRSLVVSSASCPWLLLLFLLLHTEVPERDVLISSQTSVSLSPGYRIIGNRSMSAAGER